MESTTSAVTSAAIVSIASSSPASPSAIEVVTFDAALSTLGVASTTLLNELSSPVGASFDSSTIVYSLLAVPSLISTMPSSSIIMSPSLTTVPSSSTTMSSSATVMSSSTVPSSSPITSSSSAITSSSGVASGTFRPISSPTEDPLFDSSTAEVLPPLPSPAPITTLDTSTLSSLLSSAFNKYTPAPAIPEDIIMPANSS
mmetsp:Transcript_20893/g.41578  ORF Transcript_20893/g.41578 Transcript_20893/m.41578 type:complete len:200 (-) Transcript_20893:925-1524(-)